MNSVAKNDVAQFIKGFAPDGVTRLPTRVSYSKDPMAVEMLTEMVRLTYKTIRSKRARALNDSALRVAITRKIAVFLSKTPHERPLADILYVIERAALTMADDPAKASEPISLTGMARLHDLQKQRARTAGPARPDNVPLRPVHWALPDRTYLLTELTHPWHLVDEGSFLRHCISSMNDPREPLVPENLRYWVYVRDGHSRLFSIAGPNGPACTLHVGLASQCLIEVKALPQVAFDDAVPPPVFAACIQSLKRLIPRLQADASLDPARLAAVGDAFRRLRYRSTPMANPFRPDRSIAGPPRRTSVVEIITALQAVRPRMSRTVAGELAELLARSMVRP